MAFEPGRRIGPYDIVSVLGSGGMGTVYLAHDRRLKRQVALKFLHADDGTTGSDEWHRVLLREAQIASALNHPNICHVYDVGGEGREGSLSPITGCGPPRRTVQMFV
jgi:eukaryotic-like serine/threonine-protein kinase